MARRADDPYLVADLVADVFVAVVDSAYTYRADRGTAIQWLYGARHPRRRAATDRPAEQNMSTRQVFVCMAPKVANTFKIFRTLRAAVVTGIGKARLEHLAFIP
jgi:hypothetical protein